MLGKKMRGWENRKYRKLFMLLFMISLNIQFHRVQFCSLMNMNAEGEDDWTDREKLKIEIFLFGAAINTIVHYYN